MATDARRDHPLGLAGFGWSLHAVLAQFPFACFIGAFVTDVAYWQSANLMWQYFSIWLITAGLVVGGLAVAAAVIGRLAQPALQRGRLLTTGVVLSTVIALLELLNAFVHSRDGWTAVVPQGIVLSAVVTMLLIVVAWLGGARPVRRGMETVR